MNKFLTILFLFFVQISWGQKYAFSFEGKIDTNKIEAMQRDVEQFYGVAKVKINYKPEKQLGEFIIQLKPEEKNKRGEADNHFSVAEVKEYILTKNLSPLSFITLEN